MLDIRADEIDSYKKLYEIISDIDLDKLSHLADDFRSAENIRLKSTSEYVVETTTIPTMVIVYPKSRTLLELLKGNRLWSHCFLKTPQVIKDDSITFWTSNLLLFKNDTAALELLGVESK